MDVNQLFYHHQVALIGAQNAACHETRRWARQCAERFARLISHHAEAEGYSPLAVCAVAG